MQSQLVRLPNDFLLSVIIPVYNESATLGSVIASVRSTGLPLQMILVDDGSTDGSAEQLAAQRQHPDITAVFHKRNLGKGRAIRNAIEYARGDVIVIHDADGEYDPADFRCLLQPILANEADIVYGNRFASAEFRNRQSPSWHRQVNRLLTTLCCLVFRMQISDVETCYKMAPREHFQTIAADLREDRFGIEIELTARWVRCGLRFTERPIRYRYRSHHAGKKIGWRDGVSALRCIVKYGLLRR